MYLLKYITIINRFLFISPPTGAHGHELLLNCSFSLGLIPEKRAGALNNKNLNNNTRNNKWG
jgi:hypothetical protein